MIKNLMKSKNEEEKDYYVLGHMIKYNLYLMSKAMIYASFVNKFSGDSITQEDIVRFAEYTETALKELDLANKTN